jgi:hypothetical protein
MSDSIYLCPGCGKPVEITTVRQHRRLDNGGTIYHNRECQKAAGRETRPCAAPACSNTVTRRKSGFTTDIAVCSPACRAALTSTSQVYECAAGCGKEVRRKPSVLGEKVYCSPECRGISQRNASVMVPCAYDSVPFRCDARRAAKGKPVYCSREHQKLGSQVELPCSTEMCPNIVTRYKSQLLKDREPRVFCEPCCDKGARRKPRRGTQVPCGCGCGQMVYRIQSEPEDRQKYVNMDHKAVAMRGEERVDRVERVCVICDTSMRLSPDQSRQDVQTCSRECTAALRRRKPGERYVDKRTGYVVITTPDGRVMGEHRYVMEQEIGRELLSEETVHHKKGGFAGRSNNDLSNLELWSGSHPRGHRVEDIIAYSREKLALYGDGPERERYAAHLPPVG